MPPYLAGQIHAALGLARVAESERAHLRHIALALREELAAAGLNSGTSVTHIVPVIVGSNEIALNVAGGLQRSGFAVKAIRPPTVPPGTARLRVSLTSKITLDDIRRLVAAARESLPESTSVAIGHV
jgi:8-amino-7-oxononanoate synthase